MLLVQLPLLVLLQTLYASQLTSYDPSMSLVFEVAKNVNYRVKLHFAELKHEAAGKRVFAIKVGQQTVAEGFDIYEKVAWHVLVWGASLCVPFCLHELDASKGSGLGVRVWVLVLVL